MDEWLGEDIDPVEQVRTGDRTYWGEQDFCYICCRATDHFAEHDDLVEKGYAYWDVQTRSYQWTQAGWEKMCEVSNR